MVENIKWKLTLLGSILKYDFRIVRAKAILIGLKIKGAYLNYRLRAIKSK